jgi:phosphogluconate dehydratase
MPELHKLTTVLGVLQDRGQRVAIVTDGRMSGASGKVPAAIHVTPEALEGGIIGKINEGDIVRLDAEAGTLDVLVSAAELVLRPSAEADLSGNEFGFGRELFAGFRHLVSHPDQGATAFSAAA